MYYLITLIRNWLYDHGFLTSHTYDTPVICIGNLAVGGTGKTPHTEYIARLLMSEGWRVGILSRGYGRKSKGLRIVTSSSTAQEVGDEPSQMYQTLRHEGHLTSIVCENRHTGIMFLKDKVDVILMDDAFQHRRVKAGLQIVLTDCHRPYWQDYILPYGRLRETRQGIHRADLIVVTKLENADILPSHPETEQVWFGSKMIYAKAFRPFAEDKEVENLPADSEILLVTGIAHPESLEGYLRSRYKAVTHLRFGDHHNFSTKDIERIESAFAAHSTTLPCSLVTTAKDFERLRTYDLSENLRKALWIQPITIDFGYRTNEFNQTLIHYVRQHIHHDC